MQSQMQLHTLSSSGTIIGCLPLPRLHHTREEHDSLAPEDVIVCAMLALMHPRGNARSYHISLPP